jgi:hypothetical protein
MTFVLACLATAVAAQQPPPPPPTSALEIRSQSLFDSFAVVYDPDTPYALPHVLFVIDRQDKNRIYYVNTKLYKFHKDFVNGTYLSLERGQVFFENNYLKPNRRFILGTIAYQTPVRRWTYEFWEGDLIPAEQIKLTSEIIKSPSSHPWPLSPTRHGRRGFGESGPVPRAAKRDCERAGLSGVEYGKDTGAHPHHP